jgi:hypothetical protein
MCISVLESDGVDKRTGLGFTSLHRSSDRLSIGRTITGVNIMTEFTYGNPRDMSDLNDGIKAILAECWFVNSGQGNATAEETAEL